MSHAVRNSEVSQPKDVRSTRGAWALGFFLVANAYLIPSLERSPRVSDIVGVLLGIVLVSRLARRGLPRSRFAVSLVVLACPVVWGPIGVAENDLNTVVQSLRWGLALPWAWALERGWARKEFRDAFLRGMFWGAGLNVIVLVMQAVGFDELTRNLGLAAQDEASSSVYGRVRLSGMHGHPNASLAVISLAVPAALGLTLGMHRSQAWLIGAVGMLFVGSSLTLTRAPLLAGLVSLGIGLLLNIRYRRSVVAGLVIAGLGGLALLAIGPPGGWERWMDSSNLAVNSAGRISTNVEAMKLILQHPLGVGDAVREEALGATHNAFLQVGVVFGLPFAALLTAGLAFTTLGSMHGVGRTKRGAGTAGILSLHLFGLFLWEEHLNNPSFIILSSWLLVTVLLSICRSETRARRNLPAGSQECGGRARCVNRSV